MIRKAYRVDECTTRQQCDFTLIHVLEPSENQTRYRLTHSTSKSSTQTTEIQWIRLLGTCLDLGIGLEQGLSCTLRGVLRGGRCHFTEIVYRL